MNKNSLTKQYCKTQASAMIFLDKWSKVAGQTALGAALFALATMPVAAFANAQNVDQITNGIENGAKLIWNILRGTILFVCAVAIGWAGFKMVTGGERDMEGAKRTFITCIIAAILVLLAPTIADTIGGWFSGSWEFQNKPTN